MHRQHRCQALSDALLAYAPKAVLIVLPVFATLFSHCSRMMQIVCVSLFIAFISFVVYCTLASVMSCPLTSTPAESLLADVRPDYGPVTYPGSNITDVFGGPIHLEDVHCRRCHHPTRQHVIRHYGWWSGDATQIAWMQTLAECPLCGTLNLVQSDQMQWNPAGQLQRAILLDEPIPSRGWATAQDLHIISNSPETRKGDGRPVMTHCPRCNETREHLLLPYGEFDSRRKVWTAGGWITLQTEEENIQLLQCKVCRHGHVEVSSRRRFALGDATVW
jgi:hypothetical protein